MIADLIAADLGVSYKALVRAANRTSTVMTSSRQDMTGPQTTTLTTDVLLKDKSGRPTTKRKN